MGVSVKTPTYLTRLDHLRRVPAHVPFLCFEPLLVGFGMIDLGGIDWVNVGGVQRIQESITHAEHALALISQFHDDCHALRRSDGHLSARLTGRYHVLPVRFCNCGLDGVGNHSAVRAFPITATAVPVRIPPTDADARCRAAGWRLSFCAARQPGQPGEPRRQWTPAALPGPPPGTTGQGPPIR